MANISQLSQDSIRHMHELRALREALTDIKYDKHVDSVSSMSRSSMRSNRDILYDRRDLDKISSVLSWMENDIEEGYSKPEAKLTQEELIDLNDPGYKERETLEKLRTENATLKEELRRAHSDKHIVSRKTTESGERKTIKNNKATLHRKTHQILVKKLKHCAECDSCLSNGYSTSNCNKHGGSSQNI